MKRGDMEPTKIQRLAIDSTGKNMLVSAGAGTGKTFVLVERFLNLVSSGKALVTEILALTFTEKAATEMKGRIRNRLKDLGAHAPQRDLESAYISTIHAFASRVLKEHPIEAGMDPDFGVIESEEAEVLKEQALEEAIETGCRETPEVFELLKIYGESRIREGILKIFDAARVQGLRLSDYFAQSAAWSKGLAQDSFREGYALFESLGEKALAEEWRAFHQNDSWDWKTAGSFKEWSVSFSKRGGKKDKTAWKEIAALAKDFFRARIESLAAPVKERFEGLALAFEALYEARKLEKRAVDFDDLQMKVLELLRKDAPANRMLLARYRKLFKYIMVDEYQDTNPLQVKLVELLGSGDNLFLVGDFKQSIYGFRGTSPAHFLAKGKEYLEAKTGLFLPLVENFRTDEPVLDFINLFFKYLWEEDGLPFDALHACASRAGGAVPAVELLLTELNAEEGEGLDHARIREAAGMANRISELRQAGSAYGDIVILFRAMTASGIYEQALKRAGIPYFIVAGRGFYHQPEIRDVMSFLACLENPLSDIPLAATLRSPLFQITDDTLFWLSQTAKKEDENRPLYEGLKNFDAIVEIRAPEKEKLGFFRKVLTELLAEKDRLRLVELLDRIFERTSLELHALAHPQGVRRYANLRKLLDLAREYESREIVTLSDFIGMVRGFEAREVRESEAQIEAEQSGNVVRMMSIHAAKGLEFPVVFVADLAHQKQFSESKAFLADPASGYSFVVTNPETLEDEKPLAWHRIEEVLKARETEEHKRLFYVALTRTKSRLILSGVHKPKAKPKESFNEMSCWMDWVMAAKDQVSELLLVSTEEKTIKYGTPSVLPVDRPEFREILETFRPKSVEALLGKPETFQDCHPEARRLKDLSSEILRPQKPLPQDDKHFNTTSKIMTEVKAIFETLSPKPRVPSRSVDLPVSAFAAFAKDRTAYRRVYEIGYPDFYEEAPRKTIGGEEAPTAAEFGTAIHAVLERLDLRNPRKNLNDHLAEVFRGFTPGECDQARGIVEAWIQSPLFERIRKAKKIYRELPFVLNGRHGIIQGVIDLLFQEESGTWHLLDYKTAVGDEGKVKTMAYDLQIRLYGLAIHDLLRISPCSGIIYFLKNRYEHRIALGDSELKKFSEEFRRLQEEVVEVR